MDDIIRDLYIAYIRWANNHDIRTISLILRLFVLFCIPTILCLASFQMGCRLGVIQFTLFLIGIIAAIEIPLDQIIYTTNTIRAWIFTLSFVLTIGLMGILPLLLTPTFRTQNKIRFVFVCITLGLFVINLFR